MKTLKQYLIEAEDQPKEKDKKTDKKDKKEDKKQKEIFIPYIAGYFPLALKLKPEHIQQIETTKNIKYSLVASLCRDSGIGVPKAANIGPLSFDMYDLMIHDREYDSDEVLLKDAVNGLYTYKDLVNKCNEWWKEHPEDFEYWKDFLR